MDVSYSGFWMRVEILGDERRRRWSDDEKLEIVLSVGIDGASVTQVAHRHDVTRQQIYSWRRELRLKGVLSGPKGAVFVPVDLAVARAAPPIDRTCAVSMIEVQLCGGRCLRIPADIDAALLTRLIQVVEAA